MNRILTLLLISVSLWSCKKDEEDPLPTPATDNVTRNWIADYYEMETIAHGVQDVTEFDTVNTYTDSLCNTVVVNRHQYRYNETLLINDDSTFRKILYFHRENEYTYDDTTTCKNSLITETISDTLLGRWEFQNNESTLLLLYNNGDSETNAILQLNETSLHLSNGAGHVREYVTQ